MMLLVVIRRTDRGGRFLFTATLIIMTSMIAYLPSVIIATWDISFSYEMSQVLTVTVYYINGIVNPLIYVATHPAAKKYAKMWTIKKTSPMAQQSVKCSETEPHKSRSEHNKSKSKSKHAASSNSSRCSSDTVCLPNINVLNVKQLKTNS